MSNHSFEEFMQNNNLKTYTDPSQFGLQEYTSIAEICDAMPNNSMLLTEIGENVTDFTYLTHATLEIIRFNEYRIVVRVTSALQGQTDCYINHYRVNDGFGTWVLTNQGKYDVLYNTLTSIPEQRDCYIFRHDTNF